MRLLKEMYEMDRFFHRDVFARAKENGLFNKLFNVSSKGTISKEVHKTKSISILNVANKMGRPITFCVSDAGAMLKTSGLNRTRLKTLHDAIAKLMPDYPDLEITNIREWSNGNQNFLVKPNIQVKRQGFQIRSSALYDCIEVIQKGLDPYQ